MKMVVGRKSRVLVDSLDVDILKIIDLRGHIGVLELSRAINLTHANLKKHLEKLIRAGLVTTSRHQPSGKISLDTPLSWKEAPGCEIEAKEYNIFMGVLDKIYHQEPLKKTLSELSNDLNNGKK